MYNKYAKVEDKIWESVKRFLTAKQKLLIKYHNYDDKINDIINSIEALAIDIQYDIEEKK